VTAPEVIASSTFSNTRRASSVWQSTYCCAPCRPALRSQGASRWISSASSERLRTGACHRQARRTGHAQGKQHRRGKAARVARIEKLPWATQVRSRIEQAAAFGQGLEHQPEVAMLQVAQASVDEFGRLLEVWLAKSPRSHRATRRRACRVAGNRSAGGSAAHHEQIKRLAFQAASRSFPPTHPGHGATARRWLVRCAALPVACWLRRRRLGAKIGPLLRLGEGDHVAQRIGTTQKHGQPVESGRDSTVRRWSVAEGVQQEAELGAGVLFSEADGFEHAD